MTSDSSPSIRPSQPLEAGTPYETPATALTGPRQESDPGTISVPRPGRGWTLAAVSIATFMLLLDLTVVSVALPDIRIAFNSSFSALQWILDAYALGLAVFLLTAGSVADRIGRKRLFLIGLAIFVISSLACGLAPGAAFLSGARAVQGIGGAVLFAVGPALIGQEYRGKDRSKAFGIFGAVIGLAIAVGPLAGGALTAADWRYIFLLNIPIGIIALVIALGRMQESRELNSRPVDWAGLVTSCAALALLVLGILRGDSTGWGSASIIVMFIAAAVLMAIFLVVEIRLGDRAMLEMALFRNVTFNGISITTAIYSAAVMPALFLEVSYLQNVLRLSPWQAGLRFMPLTLTIFVIAGISSGFMEKFSPAMLVGFSLFAIAVGLFLVRLVGPTSNWTALLPSMFVTGVGMGLFNPIRASLSIAVAEPAKSGMASGMSETFYQVGTTVGIAAFGAFFQAQVSHIFNTSGTGAALGGHIGGAVAAGSGAQIAEKIHQPGLTGQVLTTARAAFVSGLGDMMTAAAVVAFVGAIIAFGFIRKRDLHHSAVLCRQAGPRGLAGRAGWRSSADAGASRGGAGVRRGPLRRRRDYGLGS
jgi:EmrB/QacA subfamily drug resistance transporter